MIYVLGWASIYVALFVRAISRYRGRLFVLIALLVLAAIAFFRGSVGTDTTNYEKMLLDFVSGYSWDGQEPGFVALGWILAQLAPSVETSVRVVSLIFFVLLGRFAWRSDSNERYLLLLYILPVFAYSYSMNALRAGLAFGMVLLVVQSLRRRNNLKAFGLGLVGISFHYSALLPLVYLGISQRAWASVRSMVYAALSVMIAGALFLFLQDYLIEKISLYSAFEPPSRWSGVGTIASIVILLFGVALGRLRSPDKLKIIVMGASSLTFAAALSMYSYAGLRILDLLAYAIPISILMSYSARELGFDRFVILAMFASGVLSVFLWYYRFVSGYGVGPAPWLPYETWVGALGLTNIHMSA